MKKNNRGFTLAELLIVVAIIAVLVAIAIPVFTKQLEKSRETTDMANLRSAYGAATVYALNNAVADGTMSYNPQADGGVSTTGVNIGQGTATDGGAATDQLPGGVTYTATTKAKGQAIIISFKDGMVNAISFKPAS